MRRGEVSNKASKVNGIHTKSYESYTQYDLVWMPSTFDALLDTSTRLKLLTRGCFYSF